MALKHRIGQLTEVAETIRNLYEQGQDGAFYLQVEGMVPKAQLDEFRQNNITLMQERDNLKKQYEGVDIAEYRELQAAKGKTPEQIEAAVKARVAQMAQEHANVVGEKEKAIQTLSGQLNVVLVDGTLRQEAAKSGVLATAIDDVVLRGRTVYSLGDGNTLVPKDSKGNLMYDKDGTSPLAVGSWLKDLKKTAPHLFEGHRGGGAGGNNGGAGGGPVDLSKASPTQKIAAGLKMQREGGL